MLQPADVLLLDEPTNDLDIPTLEILEESLLEYRGALVLVTHDRYMLDRVSTVVLGLNGMGQAQRFADYRQWEAWEGAREFADTSQSAGQLSAQVSGQASGQSAGAAAAAATNQRSASSAVAVESKAAAKNTKAKLSYAETRELATIEERIAAAEQELEAARAAMENPATVADRTDFRDICARFEQAQNTVDTLYTRWAELEQKKS